MHNQLTRADSIAQARRLFFEQGQSPVGRIPGVIARSWARCSRTLDHTQRTRPQVLDAAQLNERRDAHARLRKLAEPELDALAELVADSDSVVLLADAEGMILDAVGSLGFLRKAEQVYLQPGVCWSESGRGTNAIGTALAEGAPVMVQGGEHYLQSNLGISCASAPIHSPSGEMLGVLDVSGDARAMHPAALGMVRLGSQIIEHRLLLDLAGSHDLLRFHAQSDLLGSHREAVLVLDQQEVIGANQAAVRLLGIGWGELLGSDLERWIRLPDRHRPGRLVALRRVDGELLQGQLQLAPRRRAPVGRSLQRFDPDASITALREKALRALKAGVSILLQGEIGVGKRRFARQLHGAACQDGSALVELNCMGLDAAGLEAGLQALISAFCTNPGTNPDLNPGVLCLHHVEELDKPLQARLLALLKRRRATRERFRWICTTLGDLAERVSEGGFREDLYYQLNEFTLRLPPIRERPELRQLIEERFQELGGSRRGLLLSDELLDCLQQHPWPGNLRQLSGLLRSLIALCESGTVLGVEDLPAAYRVAPGRGAWDLRQQGREAILATLEACGGNVSEAARRLGIHRSTIYRQLQG